MNTSFKFVSVIAIATSASAALAGTQWPQSNGPMWHVMIGFDGVDITIGAPDNAAPLELVNYGEAHTSPADALDGMMYNDQYGWLPSGIFTPPAESAIWIMETAASAGLQTFEGGMRPMRPDHSYAPIFTDSVTPWMWDGTMTHNWYAADSFGAFEATYEVYIGDLAGVPLSQYGSDTVTLRWNAVPAPGAGTIMLCGSIAAIRRKR